MQTQSACVCFAIMNSYLLLSPRSHTLWVYISSMHVCVRACLCQRARIKSAADRLADYQSLCKRCLSVCSALFVGGICRGQTAIDQTSQGEQWTEPCLSMVWWLQCVCAVSVCVRLWARERAGQCVGLRRSQSVKVSMKCSSVSFCSLSFPFRD